MTLTRFDTIASNALRSIFLVVLAGAFSAAHSQTFDTLYSFTGTPDGSGIGQSNLLDINGTLYGTTSFGGVYGFGTIFKVTSSGKETVLYSFTGGADGASPSSGLTRDKSGNLYGTTLTGGDLNCSIINGFPPGCGVAYKFDENGLTPLYAFTDAADGAIPQGLVLDAAGNLYGPAFYGGVTQGCPLGSIGCGVIFELSPQGSGWSESVLYSFKGGADGGVPNGFITRDAAGNLYGGASIGGNVADCSGPGCGVIFKIGTNHKETVLYAFKGGADGDQPNGSLLMDGKGNIYGTAYAGGDLSCSGDGFAVGCGVVFELTAAGKEVAVHTFKGPDGANPTYGLAVDSKGNGYGTTIYGGSSSFGTVFEVTSKGVETVLHNFTGGADGGYPSSGLIVDSQGAFYSNTAEGGDLSCSPPYGCGTVFKIVP